MRPSDRFLVRAGHEAERLPFLQIHVSGMTEHAEVLRSLLERRELFEELFFGEFLRWEATFALVVGVDEVLHADAPSSLSNYRVDTRLLLCFGELISTSCTSLSGYTPAKNILTQHE